MTIIFDNIYNRCQELSSYEGRSITNGEGESLYSQVHITSQDKPLLKSLAYSASIQANARLSSTTGSITLDMNSAHSSSTGTQKLVEEVLVAAVMSLWLEDKSQTRSQAYGLMFSQMASALRSQVRPTINKDY